MGSPVEVSLRWTVAGGHLKKRWAPEFVRNDEGQALCVDGKYFVALGSNDYQLGQFLFGAANKKGGGEKYHRNLPQTKVVRDLWKARMEAQKSAWEALAQPSAPPASDAASSVLDNLWGAEAPPADPPKARLRSRRGSQRPSADQARISEQVALKQLPPTFQLAIPSNQAGKAEAKFVVARAPVKAPPAIELSTASFDLLLAEIQAERAGAAAEGAAAESADEGPRTPRRSRRGRRTCPLIASPGAASSCADSPGGRTASTTKGVRKKKKKTVSAHTSWDKRGRRMLAIWGDRRGHRRARSFSLPSSPTDREVQSARAVALLHAEREQGALASGSGS